MGRPFCFRSFSWSSQKLFYREQNDTWQIGDSPEEKYATHIYIFYARLSQEKTLADSESLIISYIGGTVIKILNCWHAKVNICW